MCEFYVCFFCFKEKAAYEVPKGPEFRRVLFRSVGGWFDNFVESDLRAFERLRGNSGVHRILIGPWPHNMAARLDGVDFGPDADVPMRGIEMQWFDQFLKGK